MFGASRYRRCCLDIHPGDTLYLYTDGVNEAMNGDGELFGNDRFLERATSYRNLPPEEFDGAIRRDLARFAQGAEQSDDITTMCITYRGASSDESKPIPDTPPVFERELSLSAALDNLDRVLEWIETVLGDYSCPAGAGRQLVMATEEIFVNIARYAYPGKTGEATLRAGRAGAAFVIEFEDGGIPFNPLEWPKPQTTGPIEERSIGGRGIFLVKKLTDRIAYRRLDGKNLLAIFKKPETPELTR
jgi:sigma-B regulation protein RsbU (phosphoserine phosphatase)